MALTYKTDQITLTAANTDFTILTASASTTLVKNICWIHDDHNTDVILSLTKSGGTKTQIGTFSATANTPLKIWPDILPLEANDILHLQSNHISSSDVGYCIISYVEDTTSVAGQSIAVHTDVSISGITDGQVLQWNNSTTQFEPATGGTDLSSADTDDLAEGSTNLYYTESRVAANSAVSANTAKTTFPGFGTTAGTALEGDTALLQLGTTSSTALAGDTTTITTAQANAITANTAKVSADGLVTTHSDVTSAGSGSIITTAERTKLTGIATGATLNSPDSILLARANHTGTQTSSTISDFNSSVISIRDAVRNPYETSTLVEDFNVEIDGSVSVADNKIADVLGDALADVSNANAKKLLGFHTTGGICVLRGMVDAGAAISGATAGSPLWLGASGVFSSAAPTTANYYSRVVGYYIGTTQSSEYLVYFDPSKDWVQID
jgi:hypothetical protein